MFRLGKEFTSGRLRPCAGPAFLHRQGNSCRWLLSPDPESRRPKSKHEPQRESGPQERRTPRSRIYGCGTGYQGSSVIIRPAARNQRNKVSYWATAAAPVALMPASKCLSNWASASVRSSRAEKTLARATPDSRRERKGRSAASGSRMPGSRFWTIRICGLGAAHLSISATGAEAADSGNRRLQ